MKFYTIQNSKVLSSMIAHKALISNWDYAIPEFIPNYKWMLKQLNKKRPHLHNLSNSLIWLWDKIPDKYVLQHFSSPGTYFIIEVELPTEHGLLS